VPEQPRDLTDLSGSDHAPRDVAKRANDGFAYIPTPVVPGTTWRLLGVVLATVYDKGGGVLDFIVTNGLKTAINVSLIWSYSGVRRVYTKRLVYKEGATLTALLPQGFDGTLEIIAGIAQ
jgi:hypothetical protein